MRAARFIALFSTSVLFCVVVIDLWIYFVMQVIEKIVTT